MNKLSPFKVKAAFLLLLLWILMFPEVFGQLTQCLQLYSHSYFDLSPYCNSNPQVLVFEDNFDGNSLDFNKWQLSTWRNALTTDNHQEYHTLDNVVVSNGTCKIIAKKETIMRKADSSYPEDYIMSDGLPNLRTYNYTSSLINSHSKFFYGVYEIRCKLPTGKGYWPAFWTFGGNRWNEIDVFEIYGNNIDEYTCNLHYDYDGDGTHYNCPYSEDGVADFTEWHTFTCVFDYDKVIWLVDGAIKRVFYKIWVQSRGYIDCLDNILPQPYLMSKEYPQEPMRIMFDLYIKNGSNGPDANTQFPDTFEIDYIRYYQRAECCIDKTYQNISDLNLNPVGEYFNFDCGNNLTFNGNIILQSMQNARFNANNSIILMPGFSAESGSIFEAKIASLCATLIPKSAEIDDALFDFKNKNPNADIYQSPSDNTLQNDIKAPDTTIFIYSNNDILKVYFEGFENYPGLKICLLNMQGQILSKFITNCSQEEINIHNFAEGIYIVNIIDETNSIIYSDKFLKQ